MVFRCLEVPSGGRSYDVTSDDDFASEMDGAMLPGYLLPLCINHGLLLKDWLCCLLIHGIPGAGLLGCSRVQGLVAASVGNGCFEVAVGAALYVAEAGTAAHVFRNLAAVPLRGHAWGGPAVLLLVPPVVCGQYLP
ncbi:hypothetical protein Nepgr_018769 [Nepenthes gracilis]|uniref:Uncharacterized protein n=1 Tax=Nepenthes gracilis TaxID=150966 RepID=A0AAD3SSS6_NEPGR|nr:hypothetical protein Nepgr_018769 [Nepenthes gracilis]